MRNNLRRNFVFSALAPAWVAATFSAAASPECSGLTCALDGALIEPLKIAGSDPSAPADAYLSSPSKSDRGIDVGASDPAASSRLLRAFALEEEETFELEFRVIELPVADFLRLMAGKAGLRLRVSEGVQSKIRDTFYRGSSREILESIARQHELDWFEFNGIIHVSAVRDAITRIIPLDDIDMARARRALVESGLIMDAMRVSDAADGTALSIYGAPEFVGIAEAIIEVTPPLDAITPHRMAVRVRKGVDTAMEYYGDAGRRQENQITTLKNVTERTLSGGARDSNESSGQGGARANE